MRTKGCGWGRRGFTLLDTAASLLVVGILAAVAMPSWRRERVLAKATDEQSLAGVMTAGMHQYTQENHDRIMPSAAHWTWCHAPANAYSLLPDDPFQAGAARLEGSITKVWTLHFLGWWQGLDPTKVQADAATRRAFDTRPSAPTSVSGGFASYADQQRPAAYAWHPSLGMNGVYVGGAFPFGAFRGQAPGGAWGNPAPAPNPRVSGGNFYVQSWSSVKSPRRLILFASARGGDVAGTTFWNYGAGDPNTGTIRPGHWIVRPPKPQPMYRGLYSQAYSLGGAWSASNVFRATLPPGTWGDLDMRYEGQAVTAMFDGHVSMQKLEDLRDARKWVNMATRFDWAFPTNPSRIWW